MRLKLRFNEEDVDYWALRYKYPSTETDLIGFRDKILDCRVLSKEQLRLIAQWKSPRSAGHVEKNEEEFVKVVTGFALQTTNERAKIQVLTVLDGVSWPTASVILHLFHRDRYPILDFRALWSIAADFPSQYTFEFWWKYVTFCRRVSDRNRCDMRTLDRALWQFSNENQRVAGA